jgi:hypothetical protein
MDPRETKVWALKHADGSWRAPDHFISSRTTDSRNAKPFYGDHGKHDAGLFQKLSPGSEVIPHPHLDRK